jgi:hypothetical protein
MNTIRCSKPFIALLLLLVCAVPAQLHAQSGLLPYVGTGSTSRLVGYGEELNGTAYNGFLVDVPDLYTWFQWGTTTAYGNVSPTVHGMSPPDHSMSYTITAGLQSSTVYHYQAVASNAYGISYGGDATFTSKGPPVITNQPQSQTVAVGSNVTFTVGASASDNILYYQWKKYEDGVEPPWVNIPSATSSSLTISNAQSSDAGTYEVAVSSDWGGLFEVWSSPALLIVGSGPPTITLQPTNQAAAPGATVSFTASVSGAAPFSYQWVFDGTILPGATANVLTLTNVQPSNAGTYSLSVTNPYGSATSSNATLTVNASAPIILSQPAGQLVYVGGVASFSVGAAGSLPLNYQWQLNGTNLDGGTNSVLTLINVTPGQAGKYDVVVSNSLGTLRSSNVTLTVLAVPPCDPAPAGIVSWWKGEGNALDATGTNNGTLTGSVSYGPGQAGQGFVFSAANSAVLVGNPANLQLQNFTIEAWIQRSSSSFFSLSGGDACLIGNGYNGYGFGFHSSGTLFLSLIGISEVTVPSGITDTNWHHVAVTKTGTTVVFYVDGVAYPAPAYSAVFSFTSDIGIGAFGSNLTAGFYGTIDELAVYNRALSGNEIQAIFDAGAFGKCMLAPPLLKAGLTNGSLVLSWPAYQSDFNLETSTDPKSTNWTSAAGTLLTNGDSITIAVPASDAQRFFRLRYP